MQARKKRDEALLAIDMEFASKSGSKRSFTKECSPELGIAVSPDDVYQWWLRFLGAAERLQLPCLQRKADDSLKRHHYRWMPATPYSCLRRIFGSLLTEDGSARARFVEEVASVADIKGPWSSHGLASWFNVLQLYRDGIARHQSYLAYIRLGEEIVRAAVGDDAVTLWHSTRNQKVAWSFVPVKDVSAAFSDKDRARFIRGLVRAGRSPVTASRSRSNDWKEEAAGDTSYGHIYENALCHGKAPEEDWFATFLKTNGAPDPKMAGEYGREALSIVQEVDKEMVRFIAAGAGGPSGGGGPGGGGQEGGVIQGTVVARRNADAVPALAGQGDGLSALSPVERLTAMPYMVAARNWAAKRAWTMPTLEDVALNLAEVVASVTSFITADDEVRDGVAGAGLVCSGGEQGAPRAPANRKPVAMPQSANRG